MLAWFGRTKSPNHDLQQDQQTTQKRIQSFHPTFSRSRDSTNRLARWWILRMHLDWTKYPPLVQDFGTQWDESSVMSRDIRVHSKMTKDVLTPANITHRCRSWLSLTIVGGFNPIWLIFPYPSSVENGPQKETSQSSSRPKARLPAPSVNSSLALTGLQLVP